MKACLIIGTILLLASCGGDSSSGSKSSERTGIFNAGVVQGLAYSTPTYSGITDQSGTFQYKEGEQVHFSIAGIELGSADGAPVVTPVSLVDSAEDENNETVTNIVRFLLTLDDDANSQNGIQLSASMNDLLLENPNLNFHVSDQHFTETSQYIVSELTAVTSAGSRQIVFAYRAQAYMRNALLNLYAGEWDCQYKGDASGPMYMIIDGIGALYGYAVYQGEEYPLMGQVETTGRAGSGFGYAGESFQFYINVDGTGYGTWQDNSVGSGTFNCNKRPLAMGYNY